MKTIPGRTKHEQKHFGAKKKHEKQHPGTKKQHEKHIPGRKQHTKNTSRDEKKHEKTIPGPLGPIWTKSCRIWGSPRGSQGSPGEKKYGFMERI